MSKTKSTQLEADDKDLIPQQDHSLSLNERQKLKLQLACELINKSAYIFNDRGVNPQARAPLNDPYSDGIYTAALDRANWMIRKVEEENDTPIEIYQLFDPDEIYTLDDLGEFFKHPNVQGLTSRPSLLKKIGLVEDSLEELSQFQISQFTEEQNNRFIIHKLNQIAKRFSKSTNKKIIPNKENAAIKEIKKIIANTTNFSPCTQPPCLEHDQASHFLDWCKVKTTDTYEDRDRVSKKAKYFLRPHDFFLFVSILKIIQTHQNMDNQISITSTLDPSNTHTIKIKQCRKSLTPSVSNIFPRELFPAFSKSFTQEYRHPGWDGPPEDRSEHTS